jgi:hypothetical protein
MARELSTLLGQKPRQFGRTSQRHAEAKTRKAMKSAFAQQGIDAFNPSSTEEISQ